MSSWIQNVVQWPLSIIVLIIIAMSVAVSSLAVWQARRVWPHPAFKENHELVGFTYSVYGLIYGVFLAFIIVVGWQRFAETEQLVMQEATVLSELWHDSLAFPAPFRDNIHSDLIEYAQSVVEDEWPAMASRGEASSHAQAVYERLWALSYHIKPQTVNQEAYLDEFLARMNELSGARRLRILHSRMEISRVLWLVLLLGAVPTLGYPLLFSSRHAWVQGGIMVGIMVLVLLGLLVTVSLQYPFTGEIAIEPVAFQGLLDSFHKRLLAESVSVGP